MGRSASTKAAKLYFSIIAENQNLQKHEDLNPRGKRKIQKKTHVTTAVLHYGRYVDNVTIPTLTISVLSASEDVSFCGGSRHCFSGGVCSRRCCFHQAPLRRSRGCAMPCVCDFIHRSIIKTKLENKHELKLKENGFKFACILYLIMVFYFEHIFCLFLCANFVFDFFPFGQLWKPR